MTTTPVRRSRRWAALAAALCLAAGAAACSSDDSGDGGDPAKTATGSAATDTTGPADTEDPATTAPADNGPAAGATTATAAGEPLTGGDAEILIPAEIGSLDPVRLTISASSGGQQAFALYGALVVIDATTGQATPVLAESITPNDDFTLWTLKLKPGITFTDGTPYDAAAVKFNWDRSKDPANRSAALIPLLQTGEFRVVDPLTLEIPLTAPNTQFDNVVAVGLLNFNASPTAIEAGTDLTSEAVGAGPYTLESWTRDDRMVLRANPDWVGSPGPYLDQLTFRVLTDEDQAMNTFVTGDADGFYTSTAATVESARDGVDGAVYTSVPIPTGQAVVFNTSKPPFDDVRVRRAFAQGVDWQGLMEAVSGPGAGAPYNFTIEGTELYTPDAALPPYDPEAAQQLVDEYVTEHGPLDIEMLGFPQSLNVATAEFIQTAMSQYDGIDVELTTNDSTTNIGLVLAGDYMVSTWGFPMIAANPQLYYAAHSTQFANFSKYANPDVDAWLTEATQSPDPQDRATLFQNVLVQLAADIPYYPYARVVNGFVTGPELHDPQIYGDGVLRSDLVWIDS